MNKKMTVVVIFINLLIIAGFVLNINSASANSTSILPKGYKIVNLSTGWIKGSNQKAQCAALARQHYPNAPYQIVDSSEQQKYQNPTFHINSRYMYHCKLLVKTKQ